MNAMLAQLREMPEIKLALTSIGYDGESIDNVTGMMKPRIELWPGVIIATAARCVSTSDARLRVLSDTGIDTPLGSICICAVESAGKVVLAGPNNTRALEAVLHEIEAHGPTLAIIDGALSRIAPLALADGLILATGAARTTDIQRLKGETESILALLALDALTPRGRQCVFGSILHEEALADFLRALKAMDTATINGVIAEHQLFSLHRHADALKGKRLLWSDPTKLLLTSDAAAAYRAVSALRSAGVEVGVAKALPALAVTLNPYYPLYRYNRNDYSPAYLDNRALLAEIRSIAGSVPCYDVMDGGAAALLKTILAWLSKYDIV